MASDYVPLGEMYRLLRWRVNSELRAQKAAGGGRILPEATVDGISRRVWQVEAVKHLQRPDFRFWMLVDATAGYQTEAVRQIGQLGDRLGNLEEGLSATNAVVKWGTLTCIPGFLAADTQLSRQEKERYALQAEAALSGLPPLEGAELSCAWVRIMIHFSAQRWDRMTAPYAHRFTERLAAVVTNLVAFGGSYWEKTYTLGFSPIADERPHLIPIDKHEAHQRLARSMGSLSKGFKAAAHEVTWDYAQVSAWLAVINALARTRWHLWESYLYADDRRPANGKLSMGVRRDLEQQATRSLVRAIEAAYECGDPISAAALCSFATRWVPERFMSEQGGYFRERLSSFSTLARQAGYIATGEMEPEMISYPTPVGDRVLLALQSVDEHWSMLLREYPPQKQALGALLNARDAIRSGAEQRPDILEVTLDLLLRQGHLEDAAEVLTSYVRTGRATKAAILGVAFAAVNAFREFSFGISTSSYTNVQSRIRQAVAAYDGEPLSRTQWLAIHELLIGRVSLAAAYGRDRIAASRLLRRFLCRTPDHEFTRSTRLLEERVGRRRRGPGTVTWARLREYFDGSVARPLGAPIAITVLNIEGDRFHLIASTRSGGGLAVIEQTIEFHGLNSDAANMKAHWRKWARHPDVAPWNSFRSEFAPAIARLVEQLNPACRWIMLAVDDVFSGIPLQLCLMNELPDCVISCVPCLSWAVLDFPAWRERPRYVSVVDMSDPVLAEISGDFEADLRHAFFQTSMPATMVLAHGERMEASDFTPSVSVNGSRRELYEWFPALGRRPAIFHCCHSAFGASAPIGDLGGIPTIALGMACPALLAPVVEVDVETARELNRRMFRGDTGVTLGQRYLAAVKSNPLVGLYNFYGHADR